MSVVPMRMLTINGPAAQIDGVICSCLVNQRFHPVEASHVSGSARVPLDWNDSWKEPLRTAVSLIKDMDLSLEFRDFRQSGCTLGEAENYLSGVKERLAFLQAQRQRLQTQIQDNTREIGDLQKFQELPSDLQDLYHMDYIRSRFGRMPREAFNSLSVKIDGIDEIVLYPAQMGQDYVYLVYMTPKDSADWADGLIASQGFERIRLTARTVGTPGQTAQMLENDNLQCEKSLELLERETQAWKESEKEQLLTTYSYLRFMHEEAEIKKFAVRSGSQGFQLSGWVPATDLEDFTRRLSAFPEVMVSDDSPSSVKGEKPPVLLKNNFWARLFLPFTKMYGLPAYGEFDPTFLMAVTYSILFGIMYGDVGQGLVLIALGIVLYKWKKMWLGGVLASVGVFSTIFGFVFGSFFGNEDIIPGFHVLSSGDNATRILLISAAIGVVTIVLMMVINICNGIRQKDVKKIFFTNNSVAGLVFYLAVVIGAVVMLTTGTKVFSTVYIIFLILVPILVMFCQEPLGKLAARQKDWKPQSIGGFIAENFFEMFEVLLSYVTNTVSFLRVGAYAICHAGMMLVVYTLAGDPASPVVLVIGNIVVMAIEGLMVCIQVLRLEFYEMFGRFYASGGQPFQDSMIDYTKDPALT